MLCDAYVHLPGAVLERRGGLSAGPWKLVHLSFEDWTALDDAFNDRRRDYERSAPVFLAGTVEGVDVDDALERLSDSLEPLYLALLLDQQTPLLPQPQLSVTYLGWQDQGVGARAWARLIGPFEREWLVFGGPLRVPLDDVSEAATGRRYELLRGRDPSRSFAGVEGALEVLSRTARPEFWWDQGALSRVSGFIHCMAALENILLPPPEDAPERMELTATFGRNAALLLTPPGDDHGELSARAADLYRLRSRLIHGRAGLADLGEEEWQRLGLGRVLLRHVVLRALALRPALPGSLTDALAAAADRGSRAALWDGIVEVL